MSKTGGHEAHLSAVAYASDSFFINTVPVSEGLPETAPSRIKPIIKAIKNKDEEMITGLLKERNENTVEELLKNVTIELEHLEKIQQSSGKNPVSMIVSLDHSIHFHNPRAFKADEWMLTEIECPWAGEGRGLVLQRIWSKDGVLIATCLQEVSFFLSYFLFLFPLYILLINILTF